MCLAGKTLCALCVTNLHPPRWMSPNPEGVAVRWIAKRRLFVFKDARLGAAKPPGASFVVVVIVVVVADVVSLLGC